MFAHRGQSCPLATVGGSSCAPLVTFELANWRRWEGLRVGRGGCRELEGGVDELSRSYTLDRLYTPNSDSELYRSVLDLDADIENGRYRVKVGEWV